MDYLGPALVYAGAFATGLLSALPALHAASKYLKDPLPSFIARFIASWTCLFVCALYGTIASAVLRLVGYGGLGQWTTARAFKWTMWCMTGVSFDVKDPTRSLQRRPAVLVGNHQTELDVLMLGAVFPRYCSVSAKASLKWVPVLGWFMWMSKTVFIERKSRAQAQSALAGAAKAMHTHKQSVWMFPEGTRSYYDHPDLLPFKKGAFHLAIQAQVPVIPIVASNYSNILDVRRRVFNAGAIPVKVLEAVETKGMTSEDVDGLLERVRNMMLAELKTMTTEAREKGIAMEQHEAKKVNGPAKSTGIDLGLS